MSVGTLVGWCGWVPGVLGSRSRGQQTQEKENRGSRVHRGEKARLDQQQEKQRRKQKRRMESSPGTNAGPRKQEHGMSD